LFPTIEVLFTSGYTQNAIVHGGRLDPGVELISKPYRREDLARKIRQMFANRQVVSSAGRPPNISVASSSSLRVLVVEDNEDARTMVCELLMVLGNQVHGVPTAEDALGALASGTFDVLFTDVTLPGMSGVDLARRVVSETPSMKIIFSSGYGAFESDGLGFPAVSLPKPYSLEKLQQVLAECRVRAA
jgi:CheY-like chemotaxis protein